MTNQRVINANDVIELLRAVVAEKGADFRYAEGMCRNKDDAGNALCIAGHVYDRLGILSQVETNGSVFDVCDEGPYYDKDGEEIVLTRHAQRALRSAQSVQDLPDPDTVYWQGSPRSTWGSALAAAEVVASRGELAPDPCASGADEVESGS